MKFSKIYISTFLLIVAVSYSVDLHGLSHIFEDHHAADDNNHCELCIINHKKDQTPYALEPQITFNEFIINVPIEHRNQEIVSAQILIHPNYFLGQFFNRPPPFAI